MKATGGPEVLTPVELPIPTPGQGQLVLRVEYAAVSSGETRMRSGAVAMPFPFPVVIGAEAAGVVEAVGEDVDAALVGKRVVAITGGRGSYAEYAVANASMARTIPA